jgi:hypothetical protein
MRRVVSRVASSALVWWLLAGAAPSCARAPAPPPNETGRPPVMAEVAPSPVAIAPAAPAQAPLAVARDAAIDPTSSLPAPPTATPGTAPEPPPAGKDFIAEARTLFGVAACGPRDAIPARFDAATVQAHCDELARAYADYRRTWVDFARPFIASLRPAHLPSAVVYPFGGGDLTSALATFPDATEITTISLEPAGDVRPIDSALPADRLAHELWEHRSRLERLFEKAHSRTDNLDLESRTELPGELVFAMAALVVHEREPVGLRYFRLRPDGAIAYVGQDDIDAAKTAADRRALFANAELRFRHGADGPVQVLRHISANLDDAHLRSDARLLLYLSGYLSRRGDQDQGKVSAMTKAASHLLWSDQFSIVRGWLLVHTDWMISDSTGIPPRIATPAGFVQDAYGTFDGPSPFGLVDPQDAWDVKKLFDSAPKPNRDLPFRYGYPDRNGHAHLIVTRRSAATRRVASSAGSTIAPDAGTAGAAASVGARQALGPVGMARDASLFDY